MLPLPPPWKHYHHLLGQWVTMVVVVVMTLPSPCLTTCLIPCLSSPSPPSSSLGHPILTLMAVNSFLIRATTTTATPPTRGSPKNLPPLTHEHINMTAQVPDTGEPNKTLQGSGLLMTKRLDEYSMIITLGKDSSMRNMQLLKDAGEVGAQELTLKEEEFLGHKLEDVVEREMSQCSLLLAYDLPYRQSSLFRRLLLLLPNSRQVVEVTEARDLAGVSWSSKLCRGYIFLLTNYSSLLDFMNQPDDLWDFDGRYVVVGASRERLHRLAGSRKGVKTEHLVGVVKNGWRAGQWAVYASRLYQGSAGHLQRVETWTFNSSSSSSSSSFSSSSSNSSSYTFDSSPSSFSFSTPVQTPLFRDHLKNLHGTALKVVTFEFEPSVLYYRDAQGEVVFPFGIDIEVVNALSKTLNFTIVFEEPPKGELWGIEGENGEWTGMVGRLARGEADMGVANLFLTLTRQGAVDYSAPYDAEVSCFLVRTEPAVPRWLSLALPFQVSTWGAIILGLLVAGVLLYIFALASDKCGGEDPILRSFSFACFYASGIHFHESFQLIPRRHNTRVFVCFLLIYVIIITTAYSSNLTAFLTVTQRPQGINTIRALYATRMEVSGLGSFFKGALASAVDPYLQGLAEKFVSYQELDLVWSRVRGGEAAYLHNRQFLEFVIATQFTGRKGDSSMRIMKECFAPYSIAMALQRHSPLKRKFDRVISWMLASGLVRHWFLESLRLSLKARTNTNNEEADDVTLTNATGRPAAGSGVQGVIPLSISHVQGVFFIFLFGNLTALLVVLLEYSHHRVSFNV